MFPKQAPHSCQQRLSVLRIIPNALGCWLCLPFNLSTGEPVWKKKPKLMGALQRPWLHLVYLNHIMPQQKIKQAKMFSITSDRLLLNFNQRLNSMHIFFDLYCFQINSISASSHSQVLKKSITLEQLAGTSAIIRPLQTLVTTALVDVKQNSTAKRSSRALCSRVNKPKKPLKSKTTETIWSTGSAVDESAKDHRSGKHSLTVNSSTSKS